MKALLIILIVLSVILLVPVGVDGGYSGGGFTLYVRLGLINLKLFPRKKRPKKPKPPKAKKKSGEKEYDGEGSQKKEKPAPDKKEILALIKMGLEALGRFRRHLSIDYLRLHYVFASNDPFKTAIGYGYASAVMSSVLPLLENAFNIKEKDIKTSADFLAEKPKFDFWITTGIQIWEILYIAIAFGIEYLKNKLKQKKQKKAERPAN